MEHCGAEVTELHLSPFMLSNVMFGPRHRLHFVFSRELLKWLRSVLDSTLHQITPSPPTPTALTPI